MNIRPKTLFGLFFALILVATTAQAQDSAWPRTLQVKSGSVTVYPLQVEEMNGDLVTYRAALAYRPSADAEPVFGVGWFVSKVEIDRAGGIVHPVNLVVSDTRFPPGTEDVKQDLTAAFAQQSQGWNLDFPMADLVAALETAEQEKQTVQDLNTAPPDILYRDHPALLLSFDGDPVFQPIENSPYRAAVNTAYPVIHDGKSYYLAAADEVWYRGGNATGPYGFEPNPPAEIVALVEASADSGAEASADEKVTAANAPEIVVATKPTELIVTDGPAAFVPLVDDLLVLNNSADDVFMHISSQEYYVVMSGRWYHSRSLNGPWTYSASDALPVAFAQIPEQSEQADARVYVAGTPEAKDAVKDAQIPQTAAVERGIADVDVSYDGEPYFEPVEGAEDLAYASNTGSTVLQADRQYYLVEDGVWYVSSTPGGPWEVATYRPAQVASISPRSPVYNVKYVYIYDSTPDVVYVGYTPGYVGSYVYGGTVVYGTGWYYRPWVSPYYYYPRYSTWGFNVSYNSWYGWSFGLSWGWGPFYAGYYSGGYWHYGRPWYNPRCGYWGPRGYRPRPPRHGHYAYDRGYGRGDYGRHDYGRNDYGRNDYGRGGSRNGRDRAYVRNQNLYRDSAQRAKVARNDYSRSGEKLYRTSGGKELSGKYSRNGSGKVTRTELKAKAQVRDTQFDGKNGKYLAGNDLAGKRGGKTSGVGTTQKRSAASNVRPQKSVSLKAPGGESRPQLKSPGKTVNAKTGRYTSRSEIYAGGGSGQQGSLSRKAEARSTKQAGPYSTKESASRVKQQSPSTAKASGNTYRKQGTAVSKTRDVSNKQLTTKTSRVSTQKVTQQRSQSVKAPSGDSRQVRSTSSKSRSGNTVQSRPVASKAPSASMKQARVATPKPQVSRSSGKTQAVSRNGGKQSSAPVSRSKPQSSARSGGKQNGGSRNKGKRD